MKITKAYGAVVINDSFVAVGGDAGQILIFNGKVRHCGRILVGAVGAVGAAAGLGSDVESR